MAKGIALAIGFSIGINLLFIARRRLCGLIVCADEQTKLEEHEKLSVDLAVTQPKLGDLNSIISALNE